MKNFSKLTLVSFLAQAVLFFDLTGTNKALCAATVLEQQEKDTLEGSDFFGKNTNLRGKNNKIRSSKHSTNTSSKASLVLDSNLDGKNTKGIQEHHVVRVRSLEEDVEVLVPLNNSINSTISASSFLFEGDIVADYDFIVENYGVDLAKKLVAEGLLDEPLNNNTFSLQNLFTSSRWPKRVNGVVEVPYSVSSSYSSRDRNDINTAVRELGDRSKVVKFVPRTSQSDYIQVIPGSGCWSYIGKRGGKQDLSLKSRGCFSKGTIQHEFLHAMGMHHEQTRPDRDRYVTIHWGNIQSGKSYNFQKQTSSKTLGNPYDYGSVMHYGKTAFSKNGQNTITTKNGASIGQRGGASNQDIIDMRLMYQCVSGARTLSQYNANRCTSDCKCWEGERGCNNNDNACQGSLVCRGNKCAAKKNSIKSAQWNTFLRFKSNRDVDMTTNHLTWETIVLQKLDGNKYAIKSAFHPNMYLRVGGPGAGNVVNTQTYIGAWEKFYIGKLDGGKVAFKSVAHGNYLRAWSNGHLDTQTYIGGWEKFTIVET